MPEILIARLNGPVSQPEVSLMWESERTTFTAGTGDGIETSIPAPEMVLEANGNEVRLSFPSGGPDPEHRKLKEAFERAVKRYRPELQVEWGEKVSRAGESGGGGGGAPNPMRAPPRLILIDTHPPPAARGW